MSTETPVGRVWHRTESLHGHTNGHTFRCTLPPYFPFHGCPRDDIDILKFTRQWIKPHATDHAPARKTSGSQSPRSLRAWNEGFNSDLETWFLTGPGIQYLTASDWWVILKNRKNDSLLHRLILLSLSALILSDSIYLKLLIFVLS